MLKAGPAVYQRGTLATLLHGFDAQCTPVARDKQAGRVVPAIEVAAANDAKGHV
jgi:hypothetical protein